MAIGWLDGHHILVFKPESVWQQVPNEEIVPVFVENLHDISEWTDMFMACKARRLPKMSWLQISL